MVNSHTHSQFVRCRFATIGRWPCIFTYLLSNLRVPLLCVCVCLHLRDQNRFFHFVGELLCRHHYMNDVDDIVNCECFCGYTRRARQWKCKARLKNICTARTPDNFIRKLDVVRRMCVRVCIKCADRERERERMVRVAWPFGSTSSIAHSEPHPCGKVRERMWPNVWRQIDAIKWFRCGKTMWKCHIDHSWMRST